MDNIEIDVKNVIADIIGREPQEIGNDANFWTDLGVDSIKAIEITVAMERKFKVSVRDEQIPQITTVSQAVEVLKQALAKKSAA
jgi:acyl carrier protein